MISSSSRFGARPLAFERVAHRVGDAAVVELHRREVHRDRELGRPGRRRRAGVADRPSRRCRRSARAARRPARRAPARRGRPPSLRQAEQRLEASEPPVRGATDRLEVQLERLVRDGACGSSPRARAAPAAPRPSPAGTGCACRGPCALRVGERDLRALQSSAAASSPCAGATALPTQTVISTSRAVETERLAERRDDPPRGPRDLARMLRTISASANSSPPRRARRFCLSRSPAAGAPPAAGSRRRPPGRAYR